MLEVQISYLHNLITVEPPCSIRSSLVTLDHPSTSPFLYSFQYASPYLWNQSQLLSINQALILSNSDSDSPSPLSGTSFISSINSPLSSSTTPSLLNHRLKTFLFLQIFPIIAFFFFFRTHSKDSLYCLPILLSISVFHFLVFGSMR